MPGQGLSLARRCAPARHRPKRPGEIGPCDGAATRQPAPGGFACATESRASSCGAGSLAGMCVSRSYPVGLEIEPRAATPECSNDPYGGRVDGGRTLESNRFMPTRSIPPGALNPLRRDLAEREGFEPSDRLHGQRFSRPPRSTTPAPLLMDHLRKNWRRGRDSNPRCGVTAHTISSRAPSATRSPLRPRGGNPPRFFRLWQRTSTCGADPRRIRAVAGHIPLPGPRRERRVGDSGAAREPSRPRCRKNQPSDRLRRTPTPRTSR